MSAVSRGVRLRGVEAGYGRFRRRVVLDGLDLFAPPGQVTAVVGPNGAGKTTLLRVLLGFLAPWRGEALVEGVPPPTLRRRKGVGYLPESVALPSGYRLGGLLREGARLAGLHGAEADAAVHAALDLAGLSASAARPVEGLSKGMTRRAALAWALLGSPPVLLLDEPTSGLDPRSRARLRDAVVAAGSRDVTVLVASHDLAEVQKTAHAAVVLDRGRVARRVEREGLVHADLERIVLDAEPLP